MAYDGHIVCEKCRCVLYLGKHKDGRFWPVKISRSQFGIGVLLFLEEHFVHGNLLVLGDDPFEKYMQAFSEKDWPTTFFVELDELGGVKLVTYPRSRRG